MTEPLSKPEEFDVNANGGKQHSVPHRCQALFPRAILEVARLRAEGHDKNGYEDDNYLLIPAEEHVSRALRHILLWMAGDEEDGNVDEHLVHACCRIMMAIEELKQNRTLEFLRKEHGWDDYYDEEEEKEFQRDLDEEEERVYNAYRAAEKGERMG